MSYRYFKTKSIDLYNNPDYIAAYIGLNFVAFLNNKREIVMDIEDREAIEILEDIQREEISKLSFFPVYDGKTFTDLDVKNKMVAHDVFGLPDEVFNKLDLNRKITEQIKFVKGLKSLKHEVYRELQYDYDSPYFIDDFKSYLLHNGIYFINDNITDILKDLDKSPIFLLEERYSPEVKKILSDFNYAYLLINFSEDVLVDERLLSFQKFDRFSLKRLVYYFINDVYDKEIADLVTDKSEKRKYIHYLRYFICSLITHLLDCYCQSNSNFVRSHLSFMTKEKTNDEKFPFVLSSFNGEVYFDVKGRCYFDRNDFFSIASKVKRAFKLIPSRNNVLIYAYLRLPYQGFDCVKDKKFKTPSEFLSSLSFTDKITAGVSYFAPKRNNFLYSSLSGQKEHDFTFFMRRLSSEGIDYLSKDSLYDYDVSTSLTIQIIGDIKSESLSNIFTKKYPIRTNIFSIYKLLNNKKDLSQLYADVNLIDSRSNETFLSYFYASFSDSSLMDTLKESLEYFHLSSLYSEQLLDFFKYVLFYPLRVVKNEYEQDRLLADDRITLSLLAGSENYTGAFETDLPLPYVNYGTHYCSFQENYFSTSYLCLCQKESIERTINYFTKTYYDTFGETADETKLNSYLLLFLGLPNKVSSTIVDDKPLISQLHFKENICHLCQHTYPQYSEEIDPYSFSILNDYSIYLKSLSAKYGLYQAPYHITGELIKKPEVSSLFAFEKDKAKKILYPYIDLRDKNLVAYAATFGSYLFNYREVDKYLNEFIDLPNEYKLQVIRRNVGDNLSDRASHSFFDILDACFVHVNKAYMIELAKDLLPVSSTICLNCDHNLKLPYPCIYLGRNFNAYAPNFDGEVFYFCECDKEALLSLLKYSIEMVKKSNIYKDYWTPIVLGFCGLPFFVVNKYLDYDFITHTAEDFIQQLPFRKNICRRCCNISHAAYFAPFSKCYPFKKEKQAEISFSNNGLIHEGVYILSHLSLNEIDVKPDYFYHLFDDLEFKLPSLIVLSNVGMEFLYRFCILSKDKLDNYIYEFSLIYKQADIINMMRQVISETLQNDNTVIYQFFTAPSVFSALLEKLEYFFPSINSLANNSKFVVANCLACFLTFILKKIIDFQADKEKLIGG